MKYARFANTGGEIPNEIQTTLFPSRRAFLEYCRSKECDGKRLTGKGAAAKMMGFDPEQVKAGDPDAELLFYVEQFTEDCIAHEVFHAVLYVFRKAGRNPMNSEYDEELFAMLQGQLTQAIIDWKAEVQK